MTVPHAHRPEASSPSHGRGADEPVAIDTAHATAQACRGHAEALRALLAQATPESWPGFADVKRSTVRTTRAGLLADGTAVHVKLFRPVRFFDRARDLFGGARGAVEFANLREARARGLPAVEPLAFGVSKAPPPRSFLVTSSVPDAQPLPRGPLPPQLATAVGRLLRKAHDAGLDAFDLHAENLLHDTTGNLWLLDLTSARLGAPLDLAARARGLAFFLLDYDGGPRHAAAAPLLEAYQPSDALRARLAHTWRRLRLHGVAPFGRRAMRECRHTAVERPARGVEVFRHRPAGELAGRALQEARELTTLAPAEATKSGRRGGVWLRDGFVIKLRSRADAQHLFRNSYWLLYAGVTTPQPLALVLQHDRALVLTTRIAGLDLRAEVAAGTLGARDAAAAASKLGDAVGRLHGHGLRNRDLKFENLVRDPHNNDVHMVDLDGVRRKGACDRRGQAADLGRLLAAFRDNGAPGGIAALRAFYRSYTRARLCLGLSNIDRFTKRHIAARASGWASASASTRTSPRG